MVNYAKLGNRIKIGRSGDNGVTTVKFPIKGILTEYPDATFGLTHQRYGDDNPYPVVVSSDGVYLSWVVASADVAKPGYGSCQFTAYQGDKVLKSEIYITTTEKSLGDAGDVPEAYQAWVDQVEGYANTASAAAGTATEKATEAGTSAETATTKAQEAVESASSAAESAENASASESSAAESASVAYTSAESADKSAQAASSAATEAKTSEQNASASATSASDSAQTASTKAQEASESAQSIAGKAEQIDENTADITSLKEDFLTFESKYNALALYIDADGDVAQHDH